MKNICNASKETGWWIWSSIQPRTWREGRGKKGEKKREGNVAGTKAVLGNKTCTHTSCKNMNIDI